MNAQERRRERRAAKTAEWKAANPLLVGIAAKPERQVLTLSRKVDRVQKAVEPIANEVITQLVKATELHEAIRGQMDKRNQRVWHKKPGDYGVTCHGRQKMRGKSIPLI
ncbi:antitermination protein N [Dryocola sp. BD626]|uniref:antitermination protein N n=1 Tax=Dryocola sp. BD626 TaxID=3133273 RepID=UPI003F4F47E6